MNARLSARNKVLFGLQKSLKSKTLSKKAKLTIYETILRPIVTHSSEYLVLTNESERRFNIWERKILGKIIGPLRENDT